MAFDAYIKFEGGNGPKIEGESERDKFQNQIEPLSFSLGVSNTVSTTGAGRGSGRATPSEFTFMKFTDKGSPALFLACANGGHYDKVTVSLNKSGGEAMEYLKYEFEHAVVSSVQWSGSTGGDDRPVESVAVHYQKVKVTYTPQTKPGDVGSPVVHNWDFAKNVGS